MAQMVEQSGDGVFIMIVDEDKCHANSARDMLSSLNFHVIVYSSPKHALTFLENNAQDVAFVLAEVDMKPFSGFEFLKDAKKIRKDLQVLMMSAETTMATMMRCARLGACFLLKKPLSDDAVSNLWQHVNLKALRREKIKELLQVNEAEEVGEVNSSEANKNIKSVQVESNEKGDGITKICNIDAAKGTMPNKTKSELSGDLKVPSGDGQESIGSNSLDEEVSTKTKSAANVGKVSLVDYPDSEDDETNKPTSTWRFSLVSAQLI
uniref:Response regulatory domain-containing protein n=1 Tax=Leersia perrieri TaxID=77586 RepID=A0A0D9W3Q1_9ORYZ